ncbi:hypothetical protein CFC21_016036 [Triticum aestivum]|uniref:RING-type E3 ubiquitin transferase n=2 Tax=Triticum aestivum TaxID=4565 RepID=A0A3B6AVQ3_WHEAT|nr:hypothetical protein CFC21_016036 [Triticum aestivum]
MGETPGSDEIVFSLFEGKKRKRTEKPIEETKGERERGRKNQDRRAKIVHVGYGLAQSIPLQKTPSTIAVSLDSPRASRQDDRPRHPTEKSILLGERSNADTGSTDDGDEKADGPSSLEAPPGGGKPGGTQVCVDCDEDDCPICLEEYDYENPKILLQCNHDFHLGCIYAWMERSQSCPVCTVVMMFKEDQ